MLVLGVLLTLSSCEDFFTSEAENVDIPGSEPQLVVNSYISPGDTIIKVYVHRSAPYTQNPGEYEYVDGNAYVYFKKEGDEFMSFEYDENRKRFYAYVDPGYIQSGATYHLKVESFNDEVVTASCRVPFESEVEINVTSAIARVFSQTWDDITYSEREFNIDWNVTIPAGDTSNFFKTGAYLKRYLYPQFSDDTIVVNYDFWLDSRTGLFEENDGGTRSFKADNWVYNDNYYYDDINYPEGVVIESSEDSLFVFVSKLDRNYYQFHKSVDDYYYFGEDNPFAESVFIYTNIENGLGAFGAYITQNIHVPYEEVEAEYDW